MSRRKAIKGMVGAAASVTAGAIAAQTGDEAARAQKPQTSEAKQAADTREITAADLAASDKIAGRDKNGRGTTTDAEKAQMIGTVSRLRTGLEVLRTSPLAEGMAPSTHFDVRVPGVPIPTGKDKVSVSKKNCRPTMETWKALLFTAQPIWGNCCTRKK